MYYLQELPSTFPLAHPYFLEHVNLGVTLASVSCGDKNGRGRPGSMASPQLLAHIAPSSLCPGQQFKAELPCDF